MLDDLNPFDRPLFKRLAHNDTGQAAGHQAGVVIPKEMDPYFPQLSAKVSANNPAPDALIVASLFDGAKFLAEVETRYQYQTWAGTRRERRITGQLGPLRDLAAKDDILIIERGIQDQTHFKLTLVRQGSDHYQQLARQIGSRRWGPLNKSDPPATEDNTSTEIADMNQREQAEFNPFETQPQITLSHVKKVARSRAFQSRLLALYGSKCAVCGEGLIHPSGRVEVEAAHVVPRSIGGADDARNGLMLCRLHHWSLDCGLWGVDLDRRVLVPPAVSQNNANQRVAKFHGALIIDPTDIDMRPSHEALAWHRLNILFVED